MVSPPSGRRSLTFLCSLVSLPALNTMLVISAAAVHVAPVTVWIVSCLHSQIIARGLLDVLRDFSNNEEDFLTVMEIMVRLAEDAGLYKDCILLFFTCICPRNCV